MKERTIALVDIESGSVGSALARLGGKDAPKLFAETRIEIPFGTTRSSADLLRQVDLALQEALLHAGTVAARMRAHEAVAEQGAIASVAVFASPPWAAMHLSGGTADFAPAFKEGIARSVESVFGPVPAHFYPFGTAAAHGSVLLFPQIGGHILCVVNGEVSELLVIADNSLAGRGTVPVGTNTLLRTLVSHGGVSPAEARSYLAMAGKGNHPLLESFQSAQKHFADTVTDAARDLRGARSLGGVIVMAPEPGAELFARSLADHEALAELFPQGGVVRAVKPSHAMPYIAAHASKPDVALMLESLFMDAKFSGI